MSTPSLANHGPPPSVAKSIAGRWYSAAMAWLVRCGRSPAMRPLLAYAQAHTAQLLRFVVIGGAIAAFNLALLYCLRTWLRLTDPVAVSLMYVAGALVHFTSHRHITYAAQDRPVRPQAHRYAFMLVCNFLVMQAMVYLSSRAGLSPYFAVLAATALTVVWTFLFMTHVVFSRARLSSLERSR